VTSSSTTIPNPCRHACFMLSQHTSTTLHPMHVFLCGQSEMFHAYFSWSGHRTQGFRKVCLTYTLVCNADDRGKDGREVQ
jgi:hypothetical protein